MSLSQEKAENKSILPGDSHTRKLLFYVLLLSVSIRIVAALILGNQIDSAEQERVMDQISYNRLAQAILAGDGYTFSVDWYPFTPANTPTAHWSFLYPLYLVGVYAVTGYHPLAARIAQAIISASLMIFLLYRIGRRSFDERVGWTAAGLGAVYLYFIFYDVSLMTESFFLLGILLMIDRSLIISEYLREGFRVPGSLWVSLGIILGITALLRQTILLWVPFLVAWFLWEARGKIYWKGMAIMIGLMVLFILPWTVRNYLVYDAFLPLNSNAGYAFFSANHPNHGIHFDQDYAAPIPQDLVDKNLNEAQLSSALMVRGLQFVLDDPGRYLRLSLGRIPIFFNFWFNSESTTSANLMRVLSYGLYLPFYIYGLVLSFRQWRKYSLFYLFSIVYTLMHILTWSSVRYRLPIDAVLMPFMACALIHLYSWLRHGPIKQLKPIG